MNLIMAENRGLTPAISINQRNPHRHPTNEAPARELLLGTDFRHAVEFSRNGRAETPPQRASLQANLSNVSPCCATVSPREDPPADLPARAAQRRPYTIREGPCTGRRSPDQRARNDSIPTVRPGRLPIWRTARSTPGMKDARS